MKRIVVVGTQWGDEGKGKITDYLAQKANVVVRFQGGNNAGHTVIFNGQKHSLHLLPSGILDPKNINIMANGMVINPKALFAELEGLKNYQLFISDRAHITLPFHLQADKLQEAKKGDRKIGTTHKGIGPTYTDKAARMGLRVAEFIDQESFDAYLERVLPEKNAEFIAFGLPPFDKGELLAEYQALALKMKPFVKDTSLLLNKLIEEENLILFEGAQGVLLCLDHGTYPYVTSSSPTAASVPVNCGIAPWLVEGSVGVTKAYTTRVGEGPFPSEMNDDLGQEIRIKGNEFGTTTGRPRRIGWLDTVILRHTKRVSGISFLAVTLLDVLDDLKEIKIVTKYKLDGEEIDYIPADVKRFERCVPVYETVPGWQTDITHVKSFNDLPENAQKYLERIETLTGVKVAIFSVGPDRTQTIDIVDLYK